MSQQVKAKEEDAPQPASAPSFIGVTLPRSITNSAAVCGMFQVRAGACLCAPRRSRAGGRPRLTRARAHAITRAFARRCRRCLTATPARAQLVAFLAQNMLQEYAFGYGDTHGIKLGWACAPSSFVPPVPPPPPLATHGSVPSRALRLPRVAP